MNFLDEDERAVSLILALTYYTYFVYIFQLLEYVTNCQGWNHRLLELVNYVCLCLFHV